MGYPTEIEDRPAGVECTLCWGVGNKFSDFTPSYVRVLFGGVNRSPLAPPEAPPVPDFAFYLDQVPGFPGRFYYEDDNWSVSAGWDETLGTYLICYHIISGLFIFDGQRVEPCRQFIRNNLDPLSSWYSGGAGMIA
jgi:hypothetical protein